MATMNETVPGKISTTTRCTRALGSDRQLDDTGSPINPAIAWWEIKITAEMQEAADKIYANSAARRPMASR